MKKFILYILLFPLYAYSSLEGRWPVIDDVRLETYPASDIEIFTHWSASKIYLTVQKAKLVPDACLNDSCLLMPVLYQTKSRMQTKGHLPVKDRHNSMPHMFFPKGTTWGQLLSSKGPLFTDSAAKWSLPGAEYDCIKFSLISRSNLFTSAFDSTASTELFSSPCTAIPRVQHWCKFMSPSLSFDFGAIRLRPDHIPTQTQNVALACSGEVRYMAYLLDNQYISLSNGMFAHVLVDGHPLKTLLTGHPGEQLLPIEIMLKGKPKMSGSFSGSGILLLEYP